MKEHLVRLLLEEYKQQCLFDELQKKGADLSNICVNNLDIVLDIVGFPKDNSIDYDFDHLNSGGEIRNDNKKIMDDGFCCRDWLTDKYYEMFKHLSIQQKVCVTDKGLVIESGADNETVQTKLLEYVEWLYTEVENLNHNDKH